MHINNVLHISGNESLSFYNIIIIVIISLTLEMRFWPSMPRWTDEWVCVKLPFSFLFFLLEILFSLSNIPLRSLFLKNRVEWNSTNS